MRVAGTPTFSFNHPGKLSHKTEKKTRYFSVITTLLFFLNQQYDLRHFYCFCFFFSNFLWTTAVGFLYPEPLFHVKQAQYRRICKRAGFFQSPLFLTFQSSLPKPGNEKLPEAARALKINIRQFTFTTARCNHICRLEKDDFHFSCRILIHRIPSFPYR